MEEKSAQDYLTCGLKLSDAAHSPGDLSEAIIAFEKALDMGLPPDDEIICRGVLGRSYLVQERLRAGIEQIQMALKLDREGKHKRFEDKLLRATCLPMYDAALVLQSRGIQGDEGIDAAIAYLKQALSFYDFLPPIQGTAIYLELGALYGKNKRDMKMAREYFQKAVEAEIRCSQDDEFGYQHEVAIKDTAKRNLKLLEEKKHDLEAFEKAKALGFLKEDGTLAAPDEETIANFLNQSEDAPDAVLEFLCAFVNRDPEVGSNQWVRLAKALALGSKGLFQTFRKKPIDIFAASGMEIKEALKLTDIQLDYLEKALQEIKDVKGFRWREKDNPVVSRVNVLATVLERCRPGRVQQILGKTKLLYFGSGRIKFMCSESELEASKSFFDTFFSFRSIVKSAVIGNQGVDSKERKYVRCYVCEKLFDEFEEDETLEDAGGDLIDLFEDGTFANAESKTIKTDLEKQEKETHKSIEGKSSQDYVNDGLTLVLSAESSRDWFEAIIAFERAINMGLPQRDEVMCRAALCDCYLIVGRKEEGIKQMQRALKSDREGKVRYFEDSNTHCFFHRYELACLLKSRETEKEEGIDAAIAYLKELLCLYYYLPSIQGGLLYEELGLLYMKKGDKKLARGSWRKAIEAEIRNVSPTQYENELEMKERVRQNLKILESESGGYLTETGLKIIAGIVKEIFKIIKVAILKICQIILKIYQRCKRGLESKAQKVSQEKGPTEESLGQKPKAFKEKERTPTKRYSRKAIMIICGAAIPPVVAISAIIPFLILSKQKVPVPAVQTGGLISEEPIPPATPSPGPVSGEPTINTGVTETPPSPAEVVINENPIPPESPSPGPVSGGATIDTKGPDTRPTASVPPTQVPLSPYGLYAQKNSPLIHRGDCRSISGLDEKDVVKFNSASDAIASGGNPCDLCKPYILGRPLAPLSPQGIYALKTSGFFHRGNCPRLSGVHINDLIRFDNRTQAIKGGGRPCDLCKP